MRREQFARRRSNSGVEFWAPNSAANSAADAKIPLPGESAVSLPMI
jgi:hypothetical protein